MTTIWLLQRQHHSSLLFSVAALDTRGACWVTYFWAVYIGRGGRGGGGGGWGGGGGGGQVGGLVAAPWRLRLPSTRVTTCCGMATPSPAPAPVATP